MIPQIIMWHCHCNQFNRNLFPAKKDTLRLEGNNSVWSLSHDSVLRSQASTIEAIGVRVCKQCHTHKAIVVYAAQAGWYCQAFAYDLDSEVGKRVLELVGKFSVVSKRSE